LKHAVLMAILLLTCNARGHGQVAAGSSPIEASASRTQSTVEYTLPPDKLEQSKALYDLRGQLMVVEWSCSLAVLLALLFFGIAARYRDWAESISRHSFIQALIAVPLFLLTLNLLALPLDAYRHQIGLLYGLSVQGWSSWIGDFAKGEILTLALGVPLLWMFVIVIRKSPTRWWLYSWLIATPTLIFIVFLAPVVIDPLFDKFGPLDAGHPQLVDAIEKVVQRGGLSIPRDRMYEMKAGEKVTTLNAYVTGFGASKRVVVWDTTMQKMTTAETLFVFGHEMGHYVLNHIVHGLILGSLGLLLALYLSYRISGWLLPRFQQRWHLRELGDWAALPMLFLIFGVLNFVADPISNSIGREVEHQADVYGLEVTHGINPDSKEAAAHAFQMLGEVGLSYPYPSRLAVIWFYDHPPISDRVRFAHEYDPWAKGEKPRYVK